MTDNINGGKVLAFARRADRDTSWEAAREVSPQLRKRQVQVLGYAFERRERGFSGFTDQMLNLYFNSTGSTFRSRRAELTVKGYIEDTGERVGEKGRRHIVWSITDRGRHAFIYGTDKPDGPMAA